MALCECVSGAPAIAAALIATGLKEAEHLSASPSSCPLPSEAVVVVDPWSTGGSIAAEAARRGYAVVALWSSEAPASLRTSRLPPAFLATRLLAEVEERSSLEETMTAILCAIGVGRQLLAVIVGADSGVTLADRLSAALGLRSNGILSTGCRRNKRIQQECLRAAGLRAVREAFGTEWRHVEAFVDAEEFPIVLKPVSASGSDGVKLCFSKQEAEDHFRLLQSQPPETGMPEDAGILVQEFLKGKEYVVDHVSRDSVHKTVSLMTYDKRACNGAQFVCHGTVPVVDCESEEAKALIAYTRKVLDALAFRHGPSHGEVIMTADGPCLVEMNCRAIGLDGLITDFSKNVRGYSQVDVTLDAFLDEVAFSRRPDVPPSPAMKSGFVAHLVAHRAGTVKGLPCIEKLRSLRSFVSVHKLPPVGKRIELTSSSLSSSVGIVVLVSSDPSVVDEDVASIRALEADCALFEFEEDAPATGESFSGIVGLEVGRIDSDLQAQGKIRLSNRASHDDDVDADNGGLAAARGDTDGLERTQGNTACQTPMPVKVLSFAGASQQGACNCTAGQRRATSLRGP